MGYIYNPGVSQPLDSDLTSIAALTTTSHGRSILDDADAAASRVTISAVGLTGDETVAGVKTFSSNPIVSGGGVSFPAVQVASADANTLDDYEEGTFVPVLDFGGASVGITYAIQAGSYTKIGRLVTAHASIALSSKGSSVGNANVTGLPFASSNAVTAYPGSLLLLGSYSTLAAPYCANIGGGTTIRLYDFASSASSFITDANFSNSSELYLTLVYRV